jgi:hypothetical protein
MEVFFSYAHEDEALTGAKSLARPICMTTSPLIQNSKPHETATTTPKKRNPTIEDFQFRDGLPTAEELPCSDGAAVDSELQELIPRLLKTILLDIWRDSRSERLCQQTNWLFSNNETSVASSFYLSAHHQMGVSRI